MTIELAIQDVRRGLDVIGPDPLESAAAQTWVSILRSIVEKCNDARSGMASWSSDRAVTTLAQFDRSEFVDAVDELASWLYWREPASV